MEILAHLYRSAEKWLHSEPPGWQGFMRDFARIFGADAVLYSIQFEQDRQQVREISVIATSDPPTVARYVSEEIYRHAQIPESQLTPLEPVRRSDVFGDAQFEALGPLADFMLEVGIYYLIAVPALLSDGTFTTLAAWRNKARGDFSDLEKQRLSLFMRHLMAVVGEDDLRLERPAEEVEAFGAKWGLTGAETELLAALLQGLSLKEMAAQSGRSYGTVRWHMQNILNKCQVGSQKDLLREFYALIKR